MAGGVQLLGTKPLWPAENVDESWFTRGALQHNPLLKEMKHVRRHMVIYRNGRYRACDFEALALSDVVEVSTLVSQHVSPDPTRAGIRKPSQRRDRALEVPFRLSK